MRTLRTMVLSIAVLAQSAIGGIICSGDSSSVAIDSRVGIESVLDSIVLPWNASWIGGDSEATVVITDNGVEVKRVAGAGEFSYTLSGVVRHELTYRTYIDGVAQDEVYEVTVYNGWAFNGWKYEVMDGGIIISETTQKAGAVVIPSEIDGHHVLAIAKEVFSGCSGLTSITIPDGVTSIGGSSFYGCSGLTSVTIPNSVTNIEEGAFSMCSGLTSITLPFIGSKRGNAGIIASLFGYIFGSSAYEGGAATKQYFSSSGYKTYYIPSSLKTVIVTDETIIGYGAFCGCIELTNVTIPCSTTNIGTSAFSGCSSLTSVTIPDSVTSIGSDAFSGCSGLASVTIPRCVCSSRLSSVFLEAYQSITNVVICDSVTSIGNNAFSGCSSLMSVTIPDGVTSIGSSAFSGCSGLTSVTIPDGVTSIGSSAFSGCSGLTSVTIPDSVTSIGGGAFSGCSRLASITLPFIGSKRGNSETADSMFGYVFGTQSYSGGVKTTQYYNPSLSVTYYIPKSLKQVTITDETVLGRAAFCHCTNLSTVILNEGMTDIRNGGAFWECTGLTGVTMPNSVTNIGESTFYRCSSLRDVTIPNGVTRIESDMFSGCSSLASVTIPMLYNFGDNDLRNVGRLSEGESGLWIQDGWLMGYIGEAPAEVVVPEGVEGIASYAFEGQTGLERVVLPSTLRYIGVNAFRGCTALEEIDIPDSVVKIDDGAFKNCTWLQDLRLPKNLEIIGNEAFANCAMLPNLVCADGLATIGDQAFSNCWRMLSVNLPVSVTNIGKTAFADCKRLTGVHAPTHVLPFYDLFPAAYTNITTVVVPEGETRLIDNAFKGCKALVDVSLPQSITQMGNGTFYDCAALADVSLPDGIIKIGTESFRNCVVLNDVRLPQKLEEISDSVFQYCPALERLVLPDTLKKIGSSAFSGDARLETINLPSSLTHIGSYAFYNCAKISAASFANGLLSVGEKAYSGCAAVRDVYIPASVTTLGGSIFYNCSAITNITTATAHRTMADMFPSVYNKLSKITIAPGETEVCDSCFTNCVKLTEIGLPDTVTTMGNNAFSGCTALSKVALSQHLEGLPDYVFKSCTSLATLTVPESVSSLGKNVFDGCSKLESIYFVGNAPQYDTAVFSGIANGATVFVVNGSMGWDGVATSRALPDSWPTSNSREITYWVPNRYDVVFDANGGTPATNILEEITGMTYALPVSDPTMPGATFLGWWTEKINGARVTAGTQVTLTRTHTFYAHWAGNLYHVAFDANGGFGEMAEQTYVVGEQSELPLNAFARPGFAFAGWALETDGEVVYVDGSPVVDLTLESDATVTLYAVWNEQAWATGDYMNSPGRMFVMGGDEDWTNDVWVCHDGIGSMRSGEIGLDSESVMSTAVVGEGDVSFWWKVSCEETYKGDRYDYVYFAIDGIEQCWLAGELDWTNATFHVTGSGQHTLTWCYHKDDWDEEGYGGDDCAWVDEFEWIPAAVTATFDGNGNTAGSAPRDVVKYEGYSLTMPGAGTLERFSYVFSGWSDGTKTYAPGSIYVFTGHDVVFSAVWIEKVWTYADFLNSTNLLFTTAVGAEWHGDFVTNHDWVVSAKSAAIGDGQSSWIQGITSGAGTLSFWTKVSGETKRGRLYDYLDVTVDGVSVFASADTDWTNVVVEVSGQGEHAIRWTYTKDGSNSVGDDCAWLDEVMWVPKSDLPTVDGDDGAVVSGDAEIGYTIKPSDGNTNVSVVIPAGVDANMVTIEVSPIVESVRPNGAAVRVVNGGNDITQYLNIPAADGSGVVAVRQATVKEEFVKEAMDTEKGAVIDIVPDSPSLTTPETRPGLTYTLREGTTLQSMVDGDSKLGDGTKWTPNITVKGGTSAFYTIKVTK